MTSLQYYLLFAFTWMVALLPYWLLYRISDLLYLIAFYVIKYRKKTVFTNLRNSFPEKTEKDIEKLAKAFYRHFCDLLLESFKCIRISIHELDKRMKYLNSEVLQELKREGRNFALVSAHYNNWEWLSNIPNQSEHHYLVIYRPLKSKAFDRLILYMRKRNNPIMVPMEGVYREGLKHKNNQSPFGIWFLADQRPPRSSRFWTMFLNQETPFFEGVERISIKLDLTVVYMEVRKIRRGYYEVTFRKLFEHAASTGENEITLACVREMENEIRREPEYWLWSHKRFKHKRPENIKLITS
jgi:Kdo2-lipid IVA lauroyltransferase/acyltransferase